MAPGARNARLSAAMRDVGLSSETTRADVSRAIQGANPRMSLSDFQKNVSQGTQANHAVTSPKNFTKTVK